MSPLIKYLLKTSNKQPINSHQVGGFTMVELLVATVMSFLIITPILAFAVNILNDDVKEQAKASTELELQSALDYIQQDISQAFYIYDTKDMENATNNVRNQLYYGTNQIPVLVFWKREIIPNAINVTTSDVTKDKCDDILDSTGICDDVYAESLVAYYLVKETNTNSPWCQPGGSKCPSRIERWSIRDGAKRANGTYLCGNDGITGCDDDKYKRFKRSLGFNSFSYKDSANTNTNYLALNAPVTWQKRTGETYSTDEKPQVLVNYINPTSVTILPSPFCVNALNIPASPTPTEANYRIGVDASDANKFTGFSGCVDTSKNIAQITIRGDALRRNDANSKPCDKESPNCPSVTGQIGGRSGFGQ